MNYKKKYLKYKQKYKAIKYGGASSLPKDALTPLGDVPEVAPSPPSAALTYPIPHKPPPQYNFNLEEYQTTMNLFYELSQLNLEAEELHQEILDAGFHLFNLTYYSWIWTVGDNHQFADMNKGYKRSSDAATDREWDKHASTAMKKSKVKFAFLSNQSSNGPSGYWLYGKSTQELADDYVKLYTRPPQPFNIEIDKNQCIEFLNKIKSHHSKFKEFLIKYNIDISRSIPWNGTWGYIQGSYILGQDPQVYEARVKNDNEKIHVLPHSVFHSPEYWNITQHEWLRKLNNFFMYEKKKELFESYCNLRSCDMRDFFE
jgi:hypothetical protein